MAQAAATHFPSRHPNATASGSSSMASCSRSTTCAWRSSSGDENPFSTNTLFPCNSMTFALTPSSSGAVGCNPYSLWRFSRRWLKLGRAHHQGVAASVQARGGKKRAALTATRSWAVGPTGEVRSPARIAPAGPVRVGESHRVAGESVSNLSQGRGRTELVAIHKEAPLGSWCAPLKRYQVD